MPGMKSEPFKITVYLRNRANPRVAESRDVTMADWKALGREWKACTCPLCFPGGFSTANPGRRPDAPGAKRTAPDADHLSCPPHDCRDDVG